MPAKMGHTKLRNVAEKMSNKTMIQNIANPFIAQGRCFKKSSTGVRGGFAVIIVTEHGDERRGPMWATPEKERPGGRVPGLGLEKSVRSR